MMEITLPCLTAAYRPSPKDPRSRGRFSNRLVVRFTNNVVVSAQSWQRRCLAKQPPEPAKRPHVRGPRPTCLTSPSDFLQEQLLGSSSSPFQASGGHSELPSLNVRPQGDIVNCHH